MTKQEVKSFRGDFQKAVAQLEAQYGVRTVSYTHLTLPTNREV